MGRTLSVKESQKRYRKKNYEKHKEKTKQYMNVYLTKKFNEIPDDEMIFIWFRRLIK